MPTSPLVRAIKDNRPEEAMQLLRAGADPESTDSRGSTALFLAARAGQLGVVSLLLERGARADRVDGMGRRAIHGAARSTQNSHPVIARLVAGGSGLDAQDRYGLTPLITAFYPDDAPPHYAAATALLAQGADPRLYQFDLGRVAALVTQRPQDPLAERRNFLDAVAGRNQELAGTHITYGVPPEDFPTLDPRAYRAREASPTSAAPVQRAAQSAEESAMADTRPEADKQLEAALAQLELLEPARVVALREALTCQVDFVPFGTGPGQEPWLLGSGNSITAHAHERWQAEQLRQGLGLTDPFTRGPLIAARNDALLEAMDRFAAGTLADWVSEKYPEGVPRSYRALADFVAAAGAGNDHHAAATPGSDAALGRLGPSVQASGPAPAPAPAPPPTLAAVESSIAARPHSSADTREGAHASPHAGVSAAGQGALRP